AHKQAIDSLAFLPGLALAASAGEDHVIRVWNTHQAKLLFERRIPGFGDDGRPVSRWRASALRRQTLIQSVAIWRWASAKLMTPAQTCLWRKCSTLSFS
ncbi:MAG: WD40 domain-containing protein, partial [Myxococcota bacterium]|nr:WD40 domain-containing protein [Myxococcota bacterium]